MGRTKELFEEERLLVYYNEYLYRQTIDASYNFEECDNS